MNQGIYNQSANYGQFYIPNTQPVLFYTQPKQTTNKVAYQDFSTYIPMASPCIISPVPSIYYIPQQISYCSKEEHLKTFNSSQNPNELKSVPQLFQTLPDKQSVSIRSPQMNDYEQIKVNNTQSDIQYQKLKKTSSNNYLNSSQQEQVSENKIFQGTDFCISNDMQNIIDCRDNSKTSEQNKKFSESKQIKQGELNLANECYDKKQSIKKKLYQKSKFINQKNQAGFRIKNFKQRLIQNNNFQLICTLGQSFQQQNEQNEFSQALVNYENTSSLNNSPSDESKKGKYEPINFNQVSSYDENKKKKLKNLEKANLKIMNHKIQIKNEFNPSVEEQAQINLQIDIQQASSNFSEEFGNFPKGVERKCIYQQLYSLRKQIKVENINEKELSCILFRKLKKFNVFKQNTACSFEKEQNQHDLQKQRFNITEQKQQQKLIKQEYNLNSQDCENEDDAFKNQISKPQTNYSELINQLQLSLDPLEDIQIKQLQRLQNQQINLKSVQGNKEDPIQYLVKKDKEIFWDKNCNKSCDQDPKLSRITKLFGSCDQVLQSIIIAELLMECSKTHESIYSRINQNKQVNQEDQFQDSVNSKNQPSSKEIHRKFPQINQIESIDQILNKQQPFHQVVSQTNNSSTASATSSEKIPYLQEAQLHQNQILCEEEQFLQFEVKNYDLLEKFDFSQVRQITQKYRSTRQQKQNSTYKANSKYHNMNKLLMYNIMGMFQMENLTNFTLDEKIIDHLSHIVKTLKMLSKRSSEKYKFEYFSREHYHILFLKITDSNLEFLANSEKDRLLHLKCYNVDFQKQLNPVHLNYINIMKRLFYQIFMTSIQYEKIIDDGTTSKQNLRRQYCLKAISGIKKLSNGEILVRF